MYFRYVDDARNFLRPLANGWRWDGMNFVFTEQAHSEDLENDISDENRTINELVKAMCSLVDYLVFEGEGPDMFENRKLPTLDTELWYDAELNEVLYSFFEKPMCPNKVLQKSTALPETCLRSSLTQEVVRRLKNTSESLPKTHVSGILSKFSQKLVNSGHSIRSSQYSWSTELPSILRC